MISSRFQFVRLGAVVLGLLWFQQGAHAADVFGVPCLHNGLVVNAAEGDVCKALLPKCADILADSKEKAKKKLSLKIYGYYMGKDLDLEKSSKGNLIGRNLSLPLCSVVGHDISKSGTEELDHQTVAKNLSCGRPPFSTGASGSKRLYLRFQGDEGSLWSSWIMGSYPWGIRANAYQTLKEIKPDLSNLNDVLKSENLTELKASYVVTRNSFRDYFKGLDEAARAVCNGGEDVVKKCLEGGFSLTDPAIRLCSIVKGQMSLNQGGVANMMVSEVMSRTMTQHDQLFSSVVKNIVRPSSGDTGVMNKLIHACNRYTYEGDDTGGQGCGYSRRHYLATVGSCLGKGTLYRAWADWHVDEGSSYTCRREGGRKSRVELSSGNVVTDTGFSGGAWISFGLSPLAGLAGVFGASATNAIFSSDIVGPGAPQFAAQNGFAGGIEYLIRKEICGQTLRNLPSAACDSSENGIPDKPSDMSW